jgi:uncharacterized membrane protein (DUF106 family)
MKVVVVVTVVAPLPVVTGPSQELVTLARLAVVIVAPLVVVTVEPLAVVTVTVALIGLESTIGSQFFP